MKRAPLPAPRALPRWPAIAVGLALAVSAPSAARAQAAPPSASATPGAAAPTPDQIAKAKTLFDLGAKAYDSEQFPAAIQAFQEAYRLSQRPGPVFSIAQAYRRIYNTDRSAQTLRQAIDHYKLYIEKQKTGGRIAEAQQALRDLEPVLAQLASAPAGGVPIAVPASMADAKPKTRLMVSSSTKGATASLDGGEPAEMPLIQELAPGPHKLRITAEGYLDDERDIAAAEGQVVGLDIALRERPAVLTIKTDAGAEIQIDGRSEGIAPLPKPLDLSSGSHLVTITRSGYKPYSVETEFRRDEKRALEVKLERTTQRYAALAVLGVAGAGALVGVTFTALAFREQGIAKDIEHRKGETGITTADVLAHQDAVTNRERDRNAAYTAFGAAGLFAIVGAGMFFFDRPSPGLPTKLRDEAPKKPEAKRPTKVEATLLPMVGPTVGGAFVDVRF